MSSKLGFETLQLHGGQEPDKATGSRAVPIYQTASYMLENTEEAAKIFCGDKMGFTYSRIANPTVAVLEKRMALLENGIDAAAFASGTAAVVGSILNITESGDEILSAKNLYGGTYTLLNNSLKQYGIKTTFFDGQNLEELKALINPKIKLVYLESIGNPNADIVPLKEIAEIAHSHNIPVIADNTFGSPYLFKAFDFGADIVVHSATKFLGGHGTTLGGVVVDSGNFNFNTEKFSMFINPDSNIGGKKYSDFGKNSYIVRMKKRVLTDFGACLSPFNAFMLLQGIETLSLRMERHIKNALAIVNFLENHLKVAWVSHPNAKGNPYGERAKEYFPKGAGSIFTFGVVGGAEAGKKFIDSLQLFSHLANVADAKSLIIHPASTTHAQLTPEQQAFAGLKPETIQISVGLEHIDDLIEDLTQALDKI